MTSDPVTGGDSAALAFVHGGVHTGKCWDETISAVGRTAPTVNAFAVDLPGRRDVPGDLSSLTIETCVESVSRQVLARIGPASTNRVVLVGHSLAGVVIPGVAQRLGAARVEHVVFVACCVPSAGKCVADTLRFPLNRLTRWIIGRSPVISRIPPGMVRLFFANGTTATQRNTIRDSLCPESSALITEAPKATVPPSIRMSWVLPTRDRALSPAVQRGFIQGLGGVDRVVTIDAGHEVMFSHPDELAAEILELVVPGGSP